MANITNLCDAPEFAEAIADRVWREWWSTDEVSLKNFRTGIEHMATDRDIPLAFAAHERARYIGSVLLIEHDLDACPQYSPWIAALWVEPEFRSRGIAGDLIFSARTEAGRLGFSKCYLCATDANSPYYEARGFRMVERAVDGLNVFSI